MALQGRVSLSSFLGETKRHLQDAIRNDQKVTLVCGNQSADLDSLSSAILYAYFRSQRPPKSCFTTTYVPVLNIPADDVRLRPEFSKLFQMIGVDAKDLVTLEDLPAFQDPTSRPPRGHMRWIVVDHNKLEGRLACYNHQVHGVIDHHTEELAVTQDTRPEPRIIETCGSCTSLVLNYFADDWNTLTHSYVDDTSLAKLALASILIDTRNLTDDGKVTKQDSKAVQFCTGKIGKGDPEWDQTKFFKDMDEAKQDIESLSVQDILRKDYKQWTEGGLTLGMSSIVKPLRYLGGKAWRENMLHDASTSGPLDPQLDKFSKSHELDLHAVMTAFVDDGNFGRELCLHWVGTRSEAVAHLFEKLAQHDLDLENMVIGDITGTNKMVWRQKAVGMSRKQVGPLIRRAMQRDNSL